MFDLLSEINYLAVLVAALAATIISGIWYNPKVLGRAWMEENKFTEKDLANFGPAVAKAFASDIVLAFGLATFFLLFQATPAFNLTWLDGAFWGFGFAVLIHGAATFPNYVFENRSLTLFLIHIGNSALGMAVMGAILVAWR